MDNDNYLCDFDERSIRCSKAFESSLVTVELKMSIKGLHLRFGALVPRMKATSMVFLKIMVCKVPDSGLV